MTNFKTSHKKTSNPDHKGTTLSEFPENIVEQVLDTMHEKPKSLDEECILLKDGTKINCDTHVFCSDRCPHGIFLCSAEECPEGCMWLVNGKIHAPLSKREKNV